MYVTGILFHSDLTRGKTNTATHNTVQNLIVCTVRF